MMVSIDSGVPGSPIITGISNDTGSSAFDFVTRATSFSILGTTAEPNILVRVYRDGVLIGQTKASDANSFVFAVSGLSQGEFQFAAESVNAAGTPSGLGAALAITIDTSAPGNLRG